MLSAEIAQRIRQIQILTRRALQGALVGNYTTRVKGFGLEFDQLRDYQPGDDVRFIDWKSSARMNKLLLRQYLEDRNRTVVIAVDVSASVFFGSGTQRKFDRIIEVASVLALAAEYAKDQVGLILFSDEIEVYIPPRKGHLHVYRIIQKLLEYVPQYKKTRADVLASHLAHVYKKDTVLFIISDFIDSDFERIIAPLSRAHELFFLRCLDKLEHMFPSVGLLTLMDIESNKLHTINTNAASEKKVNVNLERRLAEQTGLCKKYGVDILDIVVQKPFLDDLICFLRNHIIRR